MVHGSSYVEQGIVKYEQTVLETKRRSLKGLARQLGITLPLTIEKTANT